MKKRIVILIFFTLAVINTVITVLLIWNIEQRTDILIEKKMIAENLDSSLFDNNSFNRIILKLKEELAALKINKQNGRETLKMTKDVLHLFEQNRIKVISYRMEGEENREELVITAKGEIGSVLKLIYDLSFSKEGFRIGFASVDAGLPGKPAGIVIRISYA